MFKFSNFLLAKTKSTKLEFTTQLILKINYFHTDLFFTFSLVGWNLSISQLDKSINFGRPFDSIDLLRPACSYWLQLLPQPLATSKWSDFNLQVGSPLWPLKSADPFDFSSRLTSSTTQVDDLSRLTQPTLSVHFGRNLQSMFISLRDLRNYKCFSPVSKMK